MGHCIFVQIEYFCKLIRSIIPQINDNAEINQEPTLSAENEPFEAFFFEISTVLLFTLYEPGPGVSDNGSLKRAVVLLRLVA